MSATIDRVQVLQEQITDYIKDTLLIFPSISQFQLATMVILHFDILVAEAKQIVGIALEKQDDSRKDN